MSNTLYNDAPDGWSGDKGYRAFEMPPDPAPADLIDLADCIGDLLAQLHLREEHFSQSSAGATELIGKLENGLKVKITVEVLT